MEYSFEKLVVWQRSKELTKEIYILTKSFPDNERFGLVSQLRRASVSICSNIAEGSSRNSLKEKSRFNEISFGSLMEVLNQLILSVELNFLERDNLEKLRFEIDAIGRMLNSLRKSVQGSAQAKTSN